MTDPTVVEDLYLSGIKAALRRAAKKAQLIAIQTGTPLVIWRNGRVEKVPPSELPLADDTPQKPL